MVTYLNHNEKTNCGLFMFQNEQKKLQSAWRTKEEQRNKRNRDLVFIAFLNDVVFRSQQRQTKNMRLKIAIKTYKWKGYIC